MSHDVLVGQMTSPKPVVRIERDGWAARLMGAFADHVGVVMAALLLVTIALSYPLVFWEPEETASQAPVTEITKTQELIADRFADAVFDYALLVEAKSGDILDKEPLLALRNNTASLRADPGIADYLMMVNDPELGLSVHGVWTIADSVDQLLRGLGVPDGLAGADEQQVDEAVSAVISASGPAEWGLAVQTTRDDAGVWHSPALFTTAATDNEKLGGGGFLATIGSGNLTKEHFARDLIAALRGDGTELDVWSPAADVNLTSTEQGRLAGPFIGATIAAVLLIVGLAFRSYWAVAISGAAMGMLMVWLRGGANLAGLKSDEILSIILPISIISFGIDSVFHGLGRVREHQREGFHGKRAFVLGVGSVLAALVLAATSDMAAFLSNTASGIESIVQFGYAAALATVVAFLLLGVATPLLLTVIEERIEERTITGFGIGGDLVLSLLAVGMATATVLVLVFVSTEVGLALLAAYFLIALLVPYLVARRGHGTDAIAVRHAIGSRRLGTVVAGVASRPWITVLVAGLATAAGVWGAVHLDVTFDVKDFFSPDSEFVVALDKTTEYLGDRGGEPALVYVETDLTQPEALEAIRDFMTRVGEAPDSGLAVGADGRTRVQAGVLDLVTAAGTTAGSADALARLYDTALQRGITDAGGTVRYTRNDVGTVLWRSDSGSRYATVLTYQIPDSRNEANVTRAREVLEPAAVALEAELGSIDPSARVTVTGSAVYRDDQLAGIRRALLLALPISIIACFIIAVAFMRSLRYALVSVVPILLVVAWLYGIMYVAGFSINVVTSIIGAVSIGIGIDFSTHYTMRFLEERGSGLDKRQALAAAGAGTGSALFGSATTSVAGFGLLALAPMPMFASYGFLTAIMIVLALIASLFVLPSLLMLVTRRDRAPGMGRTAPLRPGEQPIRIGIARDVAPLVGELLRAEVEPELRHARAMVNSYEVGVVPGLIATGAIDLGVIVTWPGSPEEHSGLSLASESLVVVGGDAGLGSAVPLESLGHGLLLLGPDRAAEQGVRRLLSEEVPYPVLALSVGDVGDGLRLAAITGGAMVLPEGAVPRGGSLPVRQLEPPRSVETLLLVTPARVGDPILHRLGERLQRAVGADKKPKPMRS